MSWLGGMRAGGPEIVVPGYPVRDCADLRIGPDMVVLSTAAATTDLAWSDHRAVNGWRITYLKRERPSPRGAAVAVTGTYVPASEPLWRSTRSWRNRLKQAMAPFATAETPRTIPLTNIGRVMTDIIATRDTLEALCVVLASGPALRDRLREADVTSQLVAAIVTGALPQRNETQVGARRLTTETLTAMHAVGLRHGVMGRPVPGDTIVPADEAVEQVMAHLEHSPYAAALDIDRAHVIDLVQRHYLDVEPWPFSALTI